MNKQTNINNNTYITDNNHNKNENNKIKTFKVSPQEQTCGSELRLRSEASPLLLAENKRESGSLRCELPEFTKFIKVDLFDTARDHDKQRLKVSVAMCRRDAMGRDRTIHFRALMNSPKRYVRRGVEDVWYSDPHYQLVRQRMLELDDRGVKYSVSKCYEYNGRQKGRTVMSVTVFLIGTHLCEIVYYQHHIPVELSRDGLTQKQRQSDIIATALLVPANVSRIESPDSLWGY